MLSITLKLGFVFNKLKSIIKSSNIQNGGGSDTDHKNTFYAIQKTINKIQR